MDRGCFKHVVVGAALRPSVDHSMTVTLAAENGQGVFQTRCSRRSPAAIEGSLNDNNVRSTEWIGIFTEGSSRSGNILAKKAQEVHLVLSLRHVSHVHSGGHSVCVARLPVPHVNIRHLGRVVVTAAETQTGCSDYS